MDMQFDNLIDSTTGLPVVIKHICGCHECVEKYQRIRDMGKQAVKSFKDMMSTEDHGIYDNDVEYSLH